MNKWYKDNIESEIRNVVYLLRNNGYNTTCSCGHKKYIEININNFEQIEKIATLLVENKYIDFNIEGYLGVYKHKFWRRIVIIKLK